MDTKSHETHPTNHRNNRNSGNMEKFIIEFEHFKYEAGSGYDSNSGMNYSGGYYWSKETKIFESEALAKQFYFSQWTPDSSFYRNWKVYKANLELLEF